MAKDDKKLLLCNCEGSMTVDADLAGRATGLTPIGGVHSHLCRTQIESFKRALRDGGPLLVACTQEAGVFTDTACEEMPEAEERLSFVNIREHAGWTRDRAKAGPKMAALLAEAALEITPTSMVPLRSEGVTVVYGRGQQAIDLARRLAGRLDVTCLLADAGDALPPARTEFPVFKGRIRAARGHLGAFELAVAGMAAAAPSSRGHLSFGAGSERAEVACDILVDISGGTPLFPAQAKRDGYLRADPGDPAAVERLAFDAADLVGEFDKPRYVRVEAEICAHSRNKLTGCTRCLDVCPSGAISSAGDSVAVDAAVCCGNGSCASVCPTGAITYRMPGDDDVNERLRVLLSTFRAAGGGEPVLLIHDPDHGEEMIALSARLGDGLPGHVLPFAVHEVGRVGLDMLLAAFAYGAARVVVLAAPRQEVPGVEEALDLANAIAAGLGYGEHRFGILRPDDPMAMEAELDALTVEDAPVAAEFSVRGARRPARRLLLRHLHRNAPNRPDVLPLPKGAPMGAVLVDQGKCTLCLACVGACPTRALGDGKETPLLSFRESACVQCGLCRATCPENAIALEPRLALGEEADQPRVLKEDEPFCCIRCGKPFATVATVERMLDRLAGHSMFKDRGRLDLLRMCDNCRVVAQVESGDAPMAAGQRPRTRTTEDYLRERAARGNGSADRH